MYGTASKTGASSYETRYDRCPSIDKLDFLIILAYKHQIKDVHAWEGSEKLTFEAKRSMLVDKMISGLKLLLYARSKDAFYDLWRQWVLLFKPRYPQVIEYFQTWWMKRLVRWAMAWRQVRRSEAG